MNPEDERLLRKNWTFIKQELRVEDFISRFVEHDIFTNAQRAEILNPLPNTHSMRCEKFLQAVLASGQRGYMAFCTFLKDNSDNRYSRVIDVLELNSPPGSRPSTGLSSVSSRDGETGERKNPLSSLRQRDIIVASNSQPVSAPVAAVAPTVSMAQTNQAAPGVTIQAAPGVTNQATTSVTLRNQACPASTPRNQPNPSSTPRHQPGPISIPRNAPAPAVTPRNTSAPTATPRNLPPPVASPRNAPSPPITPRTAFSQNETKTTAGDASVASPRSLALGRHDGHPEPMLITDHVLITEHHVDTESVASSSSLSSASSVASSAAALAAETLRREGTISVDMQTLEQELVRMAPTIADLFQKITKQTRNLPTSDEDIQKVKEENERLRKTNKSLIEKLNMFQQKIIQLQIENKKLREYGDSEKMKKDELKRKAYELQEMERRLEHHKKALEEKEGELNMQLLKLKDIEEENAIQKEKIELLKEMQDEGIEERNIQQEQISTLVEEKERQKDQIDHLEEKHKMGEQRLYRLEERLKLLEQGGSQARRQKRGTRAVTPPRNSYWMNGIVDRSHHANVKYQMNPDVKFATDLKGTVSSTSSTSSRKGWQFI